MYAVKVSKNSHLKKLGNETLYVLLSNKSHKMLRIYYSTHNGLLITS